MNYMDTLVFKAYVFLEVNKKLKMIGKYEWQYSTEVPQMSPSKQRSAEHCVKEFFKSEWNDEKHLVHCQCAHRCLLGYDP